MDAASKEVENEGNAKDAQKAANATANAAAAK